MSLRVLVVDDDADIRLLVGMLLGEAGMEAVECASAAEGLERLERDPAFDLILVDVCMPEMDGVAFAAEAGRRRPEALPIVFMTAGGATAPPAPCRILPKPFEPSSLPGQVRALAAAVARSER